MTTPIWLALIVALVGGSGWLGHVLARRTAKAQQSHVVDKDARADWAAFAAEMRSALAGERVTNAAQGTRIEGLLSQLDMKDGRVRDAMDHIDVLEAHIWAQKSPPPPERPKGL